LRAALLFAARNADSPTGTRNHAATSRRLAPQGVQRGAPSRYDRRLQLAKASAVYFSQRGLRRASVRIRELPDLADCAWARTARVDHRPGSAAARNQVTVERK